MQKYVSLETAKKLKEHGWNIETDICVMPDGRYTHISRGMLDSTWGMIEKYYAPDIADILCEVQHLIGAIEKDDEWVIWWKNKRAGLIAYDAELVEALAKVWLKRQEYI